MTKIDQLQISNAALMDDVDEVIAYLRALTGKDELVSTAGVLPAAEEWSILDVYQRRLILRLWVWSETREK